MYSKLLNKENYCKEVLNIEREQKKPRKDFSCYSDVKTNIWYMFDEYFYKSEQDYDWQNIKDTKMIKEIVVDYFNNYYNSIDDKDMWFEKMKQISEKYGFASNIKDYKEDPTKYNGNITDIATIIRVSVTKCSNTPDLYEILRILGVEEIKNRIEII